MDPYVGGRRVRRSRPARGTPETKKRRIHRIWHSKPYSMEKRPSFGLWLRVTWLDIVTMLLLGAVALGVYTLPPAGTRMFPLTVLNERTGEDTGQVVYPQFAYPYRHQIIRSWLDAVLAIVTPLAFLLLAQIRIRSFWDLNNSIIGLIYALESSAAFQVTIKWLIGGLRPHFYDVCKPDPSLASDPGFNTTGLNGLGYKQYMFTSEICTNDSVRSVWTAMQSFPSGHSTTISAGAIYLYLYLNAKLKVFANYHPSMWKLVLLYCPILGAVLVCGSLTVDESHNWYDILAGAIIGTVFAFSAYRMVYASIWDWRINHIPLNRGSAFARGEGYERLDLVLTNRASWRAVESEKEKEKEKEKETLPGPTIRSRNLDGHSSANSDGYSNSHRAGPRSASGRGSRHRRSSSRHSRARPEDMV